jgi:hypothetical protein
MMNKENVGDFKNIHHPTQNEQHQSFGNIFKQYKQITNSQTSQSINVPRGTNPKRNFGRELPANTASVSGSQHLVKKKGSSQESQRPFNKF